MTSTIARDARTDATDRDAASDRLPPHSPMAERALISCALQNPALLLNECAKVRPVHFYEVRHGVLWRLLRELTEKRQFIDLVTLTQALKDRNQTGDVGGAEYFSALWDAAPSPAGWRYYFEIVSEKYALRCVQLAAHDIGNRVHGYDGRVSDFIQGVQAELEIASALTADKQEVPLKVWTCEDIKKHEINPKLRLVGDNEISRGHDGVFIIAGPGGSGKSLVVASLAMAGARGNGVWMGRPVHRKFRTLILQAENGAVRLKGEIDAIARNHPELEINEHLFISEPPEGGLPFHNPNFRRAVRNEVEKLKPDLVIVDPWSQVASEDAAKEVVDKVNEIRSCFPAGDDRPGLGIVAHTKKPRPEDVRRGRGLAYLVSGSIALTNTARCVYCLLPWTDDFEDDRVYWACPKLNNGEMYRASVWRRRFGSFFEHDATTDPLTWGMDDSDDDGKQIKEADLINAFSGLSVLKKADLARRLEGVAASATVYRAIARGGYLAHLIETTAEGWIQLKATS